MKSALAHPPAAVRRQQDRDFGVLAPALQPLSELQGNLVWLLLQVIDSTRGHGLISLTDKDAEEGLDALIATLETEQRGVIYEHRPATLPAQRLVTDVRSLLRELAERGTSVPAHDVLASLKAARQLASGVREAGGSEPSAFLDFVRRVLATVAPADHDRGSRAGRADAPSIIVP